MKWDVRWFEGWSLPEQNENSDRRTNSCILMKDGTVGGYENRRVYASLLISKSTMVWRWATYARFI